MPRTQPIPSKHHASQTWSRPHRQPGSMMDCETFSAVLRGQPRLPRARYMVTHLSPLLLLSLPHLLPSIRLSLCLLTLSASIPSRGVEHTLVRHIVPFHSHSENVPEASPSFTAATTSHRAETRGRNSPHSLLKHFQPQQIYTHRQKKTVPKIHWPTLDLP
jgi:hypothetical protein